MAVTSASYHWAASASAISFQELLLWVFAFFHYCKPFYFTMHFNSLSLQQLIHHNKSSLNKMCDNKLFISCTIIWCGFSYMNNAIFMASLCGCLMMFMNSNYSNCNFFNNFLHWLCGWKYCEYFNQNKKVVFTTHAWTISTTTKNPQKKFFNHFSQLPRSL